MGSELQDDRATASARPASPAANPTFRDRFARWGRRVRAHLAVRRIVAGSALGLLLGVLGAGIAWQLGLGALRPWMATFGLAGALAGAAVAYRRRWDDAKVALYLDHKLAAEEVIATAIELEDEGASSRHEVRAAVVEQASKALSVRPPREPGRGSGGSGTS